MGKYAKVQHTLSDKGMLVPVSSLEDKKTLATLFGSKEMDIDTDWYSSLFLYGQDAKDYFDTNDKSIRGYTGKVYANKLFFDFDSQNLDNSKKDALELIHRLHSAGINPETHAKVYFSGNKGFHVEVPISANLEPEELKSICVNLAENIDTFDSQIYNTNRIIRLPNTKHQKSGLFKIELDPLDLVEKSVDQIKEMAKNPQPATKVQEFTNTDILNSFKTVKTKKVQQVIVEADESGIRGLEQVDYTSCPKTKPRCIHALEHGVMMPGVGERNKIFLRLAAYYRNQGETKETAYGKLKAVARENARLYPDAEPFKKEEIFNTVISSVFAKNGAWKVMPGSYGTDPENELLKKYCDAAGKYTNKSCPLHGRVHAENSTMQITEVFDSFNAFAENFDKNIVKTGINFVDTNMKITTGTTTLLVGAAGSGKTTVALNILENSNSIGQDSVFFSMDMHKNLIYLKLAQKCTNYKQDDIFYFHKTKDKTKIEYIRDAIAAKYGNTHFDFSSTLSLDMMRDKVFDLEQKTGKKMKFVLQDYAGRISGPFSDKYANATYNALKSVEVANVTDAAWIILSQISRQVGDGCTPLRTKRAAKESGDWEESATGVITVWRPFMGDQTDRDDVMRMFLAKNRMGSELETVLHWDGAKGHVRDMTFDELAEYDGTRGDKAEKEYMKQRMNKTT